VTCRVVIDDPVFVAADALARPVNETLRATTVLGRRLEDAAGPELTAQLHTSEPLDVGAAVVTSSGRLEARLLIHAVVMTREARVSRDGVRRAMTAVLQRGADWGLRSIAVIPFGLGAGNLDIEGSAHAMLEGMQAWNDRAKRQVDLTVVVENADEAAAFSHVARGRLT
jgi:O-acetyl-ADP-ribose deacetylase (regulator of RNase III)